CGLLKLQWYAVSTRNSPVNGPKESGFSLAPALPGIQEKSAKANGAAASGLSGCTPVLFGCATPPTSGVGVASASGSAAIALVIAAKIVHRTARRRSKNIFDLHSGGVGLAPTVPSSVSKLLRFSGLERTRPDESLQETNCRRRAGCRLPDSYRSCE